MQIRGWQLWGANGRPPSNCRRPVARRNLRAVLIGADADLGHDEFHQFRPWRIRHARHVCRIPGRGLAAWRPGGIHPCRGLCSACAWHCDLSFAYPSCHSRSDACADSLDLRTCIIASLYGVLHLLREFCVAAANRACRHGEFRRRIFAGGTARRRRHCDRAYGGAAHLADPLDHRQQAVGRRGRSRRRDADGHPAGPHANAGLGAIGRRGRHCRRADGDRLSVVAVGRRDLRPDRFRRRGAWRLRQRTRVALCRADHRIDPGRLRILARRNLQRHRGLRPVRRAAVVPAARIDGEGVNKALGSRLAVVLLAAGLLLYPMVLSGAFYRDIGVTFLLAAISASAWNIVGGYAGQVSVGHSMFFGLGAYTPLMFYTLWGWPPITGIPAGIALAIGLSLIIGTPTFRLTGHYFSMATIAVAELIRIFTGTWDFVAATIGLQGPAIARGWWDLTFRSELPYYYLFLAVLALLLAVTMFIERRRFGFYLRAIKASERAARSLGVPVRRTKMQALALSAAFTSVAGSLYVIKTGFIDPDSGFGILISVQMVIIAALGGAGTLFGPLVGALILIPLQSASNTWFGGGGSGLTYILYGGIIVLIARFEPGGLFDLWQRVVSRFRSSKASAARSYELRNR